MKITRAAIIWGVLLCGALSVRNVQADDTGVRGIEQAKGAEGHFGQTYTLKSGFNYTLLSAAYSIERVNTDETFAPVADEKLIVLKFKLKNSGKEDAYFDVGAHTYTAVDANGEDHQGGSAIGRASTGKPMVTTLKPGQGYDDLYTVLRVPGKGALDKLILNQGRMGTEEELIRFPLAMASTAPTSKPNPAKNEVAPLPEYARDPADASGASTLPRLAAKIGVYYPLANFDVKLESVSYTTNPITDAAPEEGKQDLVALLTIKNRAAVAVTTYNGFFEAQVKDADNEKYEIVQGPLKAKKDEEGGRALDPGEEQSIRYVFVLPKDTKGKTLSFNEVNSHSFAFDIAVPMPPIESTITMQMTRNWGLKILTGNGNPALAQEICDYLGEPLSPVSISRFSNENIFVQIQDNVREADCYVVQPFCSPVHESIMEMLIMMDALRSASARRITAVIPYYSYARSDKKDAPRISIAGRLMADLLVTAGAQRVLTMTLHASQVHGFFSVPTDHLVATPILAKHFAQLGLENTVVVAPDAGHAKRAGEFGERLGIPIAFVDKRRISDTEVETTVLVGDVRGKNCLIVDDEIAAASTTIQTMQALYASGAASVHATATHGVLCGPAIERLKNSDLKQVVVTNTVAVPEEKRFDRLQVLSVAPLFGEAIKRIHTGESLSQLFLNRRDAETQRTAIGSHAIKTMSLSEWP